MGLYQVRVCCIIAVFINLDVNSKHVEFLANSIL